MRILQRKSSVRHVAGFTLGILFAALAQFGAFHTQPAFAACSGGHINVEGWDASTLGLGNRGDVYTPNIDFGNLYDDISRSLFVVKTDQTANVEVGWLAPTGLLRQNATVYFEIKANGSQGSARLSNYNVSANSTHNYKVSAPGDPNANGNWTWKAYFDSTSFDSAILGFHKGYLITNSERDNCNDTLYSHLTNLNNCWSTTNGACNWLGSYSNLRCFVAPSSITPNFDRIDNKQHFVRSGGVYC